MENLQVSLNLGDLIVLCALLLIVWLIEFLSSSAILLESTGPILHYLCFQFIKNSLLLA